MSTPPVLYTTYTTNPDATVDAHVLSLLSATSPLSYNSATGQFTIQQASGAQAGYLSAADWNTFNNKQAALTLPLSIANGGTNNAGPFTAGSVIFSNGTLLTQDNSKLFWDDTNFALCVGTVTQAAALTVVAQTAGQAGCSIIGAQCGSSSKRCGRWIDVCRRSGGMPVSGAGVGRSILMTAGAGGAGTTGTGSTGGAITITTGAAEVPQSGASALGGGVEFLF